MGEERIRLKVGGRAFVVARSTGEAIRARLAAGELKTMEDVEAELLRLESARKPRHVDYAVGTAAGVEAAIKNGTFSGWHTAEEIDAKVKADGIVKHPDGGYDFSALFARKRAEKLASFRTDAEREEWIAKDAESRRELRKLLGRDKPDDKE